MKSFMFAGQGAQYQGMGSKIASQYKGAANVFANADSILGYSISDICFNGTLADLTPCAVCQPAIFTVSMAFHTAYMSEHPEEEAAVCGGLSLGEFSAACVAGVFDFTTALKLVAARGKLMDKCCQENPGGMAAVLGAEPEIVEQLCNECELDVANYNCPGQLVISGENAKLEKAMAAFDEKGIRVIKLTVAGAYHSRVMAPAAEAFGKVLDKCDIGSPKCDFVQNVVGTQTIAPDEIRNNLRKQVSSSVRWEQCVRYMMSKSDGLLEFGPGGVLCGFMRRIDKKFPAAVAISE